MKTKRQILEDFNYNEESVFFKEPDYDDAIIGVDENGRIIYSYSEMVRFVMNNYGCNYEDACDFVDFNAVNSLCNLINGPIIVYNTDILK